MPSQHRAVLYVSHLLRTYSLSFKLPRKNTLLQLPLRTRIPHILGTYLIASISGNPMEKAITDTG